MKKKAVRVSSFKLNSKILAQEKQSFSVPRKLKIFVNSKRSFEFSFAWMFALLVGAFILFLAIYASIKVIKTGQYKLDTITAKQLSIIFEPMETGLASGKSSIAELREESRIYNECFSEGDFGKQKFSFSSKNFGKWSEKGGEISVPNKYISSDDMEQGKEIYFFSKPFEMPWKVSEIIFLTTEKYCFVNAPNEIENEVSGLNLQNIKLNDCSQQDVKVCFGFGSDCDIRVIGTCKQNCNDLEEYTYGYVEKNKEKMFYDSSLLYAGIFSSKEVYECNIKRLMKRLTQQALLFKDEADFLVDKCKASSSEFIQLANIARMVDKSDDLLLVRQIAREVELSNEQAECQLW